LNPVIILGCVRGGGGRFCAGERGVVTCWRPSR